MCAGAPTSGPLRLDALSALVTAASAASGAAKHVYVLKFFGDTTASQVASLRQEVTPSAAQPCTDPRGHSVASAPLTPLPGVRRRR